MLTKCLIKFLILNKNKWFEHAVCSDLCPDISSVAHESQQLEHLNVRDFFWPGLKMFVRWRSGYPVIWEQYEHTYSIVFFFSYLLFYSTYWLFPHALGQLFCFFLYGALFFDKPLLFPNLFLNLPLFWNFVSAHSFVLSLPICIVISLLLKKILIFFKKSCPFECIFWKPQHFLISRKHIASQKQGCLFKTAKVGAPLCDMWCCYGDRSRKYSAFCLMLINVLALWPWFKYLRVYIYIYI